MRPHTNNSFSYKTINKRIRNILEERSKLDNTTQVSMPFIKATTTLQLPEILGSGVGFTLGIHATELDIKYQDIYASQDGQYLAGYTYQPDGTNKLIYASQPTRTGRLLKVFDLGADVYDTTDFSAVPPPGITRVTVGKRRSGLISVANISFSVPTLIQLEFLHKTFLIPGVGMILEWGQQFAPKKTEFSSGLGETGLIEDFSQYMFPWYGENAYGETKEELFQRLARNQISTQEILEKYSYPTQGQYQWMYGRVATFNVNSNPDGSYECMVRITGPAENSWAYSVRNTSVPATSRRSDIKVCIDDANSVESYFTKESGIDSFVGVLEATINGQVPALTPWKDFVKKFNKPDTNEQETTSQESAEDLEDAYFISWRYFVNVILNDEQYGVKSIFRNANQLPEWLDKIALLRKYNNINGLETDTTNFEDPYENFVGTNLFLRSTDLSTMIVVNEKAAEEAEQDPQRRLSSGNEGDFFIKNTETQEILDMGDFYTSAVSVNNPPRSRDDIFDRAFLSTGVWINHKAIIQSFSTANTILDGIQNLLNRMSSATNGYWNLVVDVSEPAYDEEDSEQSFGVESGVGVYNYSVVDLNYAEHSEYAVKEFLNPGGENKVHVFNKFIRNQDGVIVGSELTDCKVDISLPPSMFSQIATLGIVQPEDPEFGEELTGEPAVISDINDKLREMFSITSIARREDGTSADLTALAIDRPPSGSCTDQTTARNETGILASGIADRSSEELTSEVDIETRRKEKQDSLDELNEFITECEENCGREEPEEEPTEETGPLVLPDDTRRYISNTPWSAGFISYCVGESGSPFNFSGSHVGYAQPIRTGTVAGWQTLNPRDATVQRGDIIIQNRAGNTLSFQTNPWSGASHGDIVTSVNGVTIRAIGGNLSDTVKFVNYPAIGNKLSSTNFFVILRPPSGNAERLVSIAEREERLWSAGRWVETTPEAFSTIDKYYKAGRLRQNLAGPIASTGGPRRPESPPQDNNFVTTDTCPTSPPLLRRNRNRIVSVNTCNRALQDRERLRRELQQLSIQQEELPRENKLRDIKRKFPHLGALYRYFEPFTDYMVANIRKISDGSSSNAFGAAPGALSIKADLELPGINGLRLGELFWLDRIPSFYRAYGAFIVLGLEEEITPAGWVTKIGATFYYLGNSWKSQMAKILSEESES